MRLLLKRTLNFGDIEITDGVVTSIGEDITKCDEELDCSSIIAWPGLIDSHVHFRTPGQEYKEDWITGSSAALSGGITSVIDMPNNSTPVTTQAILNEKNRVIKKKAQINYKLAMTATDDTIKELIIADPAIIKLYMGSSTGDIAVTKSDKLERIFDKTSGQLMIHAENEDIIRQNEQTYKEETEPEIHSAIRGREAAIAATQDALELAEMYDRAIYICHVSTIDELNLVKAARKKGITVYVEVTPHHLYFNEHSYKQYGSLVKVNPPLRTEADNEALWQGISDGTVDVIATDHAPHTFKEKTQGYWEVPSGIPGLEFMFPLLLTAVYDKKIILKDIERCCITNPAKIFGFEKSITTGKPADIVLFNPNETWVVQSADIRSKCGWSPYKGFEMHGKIIKTIKTL